MANRITPYEAGMRITYDSASQKTTVTFRGRITVLDGIYESENDATNAGEMHCRHLGWRPETKPKSGVSMMRRR